MRARACSHEPSRTAVVSLPASWIATLLEEAENERMHLLTFQQLRNPGIIFRSTVLVAQGIFWNAYFCTSAAGAWRPRGRLRVRPRTLTLSHPHATHIAVAYMVSPRTCHRFIGYLEEEAVLTYTHAIEALDDGTETHCPAEGTPWRTRNSPLRVAGAFMPGPRHRRLSLYAPPSSPQPPL